MTATPASPCFYLPVDVSFSTQFNNSNMNNIERLATLNRIRKLSRLMDTAIGIPGTKFRIGLDPIIGLVPGAGDLVDTAFSAYLIYLATRFNIPRKTLGKMIYNIGLEAVIGTVPLVGDIFDAFYKSNMRNLALLEAHLEAAEPELAEAAKPVPEPVKR
ncbi:MAG: DUF4112 domain-containing protein [Oscillatoriaceae cyanobacterium Prado104]|jgi:hypothetical protein|nr:DUF4112 domain-containing protein [Oscillatoriaceae cyanobacterium Prado104]